MRSRYGRLTELGFKRPASIVERGFPSASACAAEYAVREVLLPIAAAGIAPGARSTSPGTSAGIATLCDKPYGVRRARYFS